MQLPFVRLSPLRCECFVVTRPNCDLIWRPLPYQRFHPLLRLRPIVNVLVHSFLVAVTARYTCAPASRDSAAPPAQGPQTKNSSAPQQGCGPGEVPATCREFFSRVSEAASKPPDRVVTPRLGPGFCQSGPRDHRQTGNSESAGGAAYNLIHDRWCHPERPCTDWALDQSQLAVTCGG